MEESAGLGVQLLPGIILGLIYGALVFVTARKRRINPWPWAIASAIPFFGVFAFVVFFFVTMFSTLDRLNALEEQSASNTFS